MNKPRSRGMTTLLTDRENEVIDNMIEHQGLTITKVIDRVINRNAIIGVGLISLGDQLKEYCYDKAKHNNHES